MGNGEWGMGNGEFSLPLLISLSSISSECDDVNLSPATAPLSVQDFPALLLQPLGD